MNVYLESGYLDIRAILRIGMPFTFIVGGRGTGKTYGALEVVVEDKHKFLFMRRTQTQADLINKPEFSPFKSLNIDHEWSIGTSPITKYNSGFYNMEENDKGKLVPAGELLGITAALSTISNVRGFDASDVDIMLYDEFIPEKHERPIKNEGAAFFNAYETINRNRELKGKKPLQAVCLANANNLANDIFMQLKIVRKAETMKRKGQEISIDRDRGICIIILNDSPISRKKVNTALYKLTDGTDFGEMSIHNRFSGEEVGKIKSRPLQEYKPVVSIGEITIYEHKSKHEFYVSTHRLGSAPMYGIGDIERGRFKRVYSHLWTEYMCNTIDFEEYLCEILFTKYFD